MIKLNYIIAHCKSNKMFLIDFKGVMYYRVAIHDLLCRRYLGQNKFMGNRTLLNTRGIFLLFFQMKYTGYFSDACS